MNNENQFLQRLPIEVLTNMVQNAFTACLLLEACRSKVDAALMEVWLIPLQGGRRSFYSQAVNILRRISFCAKKVSRFGL